MNELTTRYQTLLKNFLFLLAFSYSGNDPKMGYYWGWKKKFNWTLGDHPLAVNFEMIHGLYLWFKWNISWRFVLMSNRADSSEIPEIFLFLIETGSYAHFVTSRMTLFQNLSLPKSDSSSKTIFWMLVSNLDA